MPSTPPPVESGGIDRRDGVAMAAILAAALAAVWIFGELIPAGDGYGFGDGKTYGRLAQSFPDFRYVDEYRMARILPSMAVNFALRALPVSATVPTTVWLFRLMNVTLLVGSAGLWYLIARRWALSRAAAWLGFTGLFVSFANLKFALYYPTLTDTASFAAGMLLLFVFLIRSTVLTTVVAAAALFISPPLAACALVLLLIPRLDTVPPGPPGRRTALMASGAAAAAGAALAWWLWRLDGRFEGWVVSGGEEAWRDWMLLSVAVAAVYLAFGARPLLVSLLGSGREWGRRLLMPDEGLYGLLIRAAVVGSLTIAAVAVYQVGVEVTARDPDIIVDRMLYLAVARPLAFGVAHVAHFGPIVVLAALLWPRVARRVHRYGPGMVMLFLGTLVLGLTSESRTITAVVPFVASFAALAADRDRWRGRHVAVFAALSLAVSRVWLPINQGPIDEGSYLEFPAQRYFMNFAPWASNRSYLVFLAVLAVVAAATAVLLHAARREPQPVRPG